MQKKLIALAVAAVVSTPALADNANITFYGVADAAFGTIQHSLPPSGSFVNSINPVSAIKVPTAAGALDVPSQTGMFDGGISDSRFGIKGSEELGGGMKAFFVLETGFNVTTGQINNAAASLANGANEVGNNSSQNGQLFGRQANAGISDESLGAIALGLNYNPIYDVLTTYDPVQYAGLFSPLGFSGTIGGGGGISEDTRVANSLKYKNNFGPINLSLLYKSGGSASDGSGNASAINLGYEDNGLGVQAVVEQFTNALKTGTSTIGTISGTLYNSSAWLLAAKYKADDLTVKAGYEHMVLSAASGTITNATASMFGYVTNMTTATGSDLPTNVYFVGGDYNLTPVMNLALGYFNVHNVGTAATSTSVASTATAAGQTANKQLDGISTYVSLLLDYRVTKRTDAYVGAMWANYTGDNFDPTVTTASSGIGNGAAVYNNAIYAVGLRHKF